MGVTEITWYDITPGGITSVIFGVWYYFPTGVSQQAWSTTPVDMTTSTGVVYSGLVAQGSYSTLFVLCTVCVSQKVFP